VFEYLLFTQTFILNILRIMKSVEKLMMNMNERVKEGVLLKSYLSEWNEVVLSWSEYLENLSIVTKVMYLLKE
jgi:hypothetical protein